MKPTAVALYLALAGFAAFSITLKQEIRGSAAIHGTHLKINEPAPSLTLPDRTGQTVELAEVCKKNRLVMVNFWASWCGPCRMEMPQFEKLYKAKKSEGLEILAVSVDEDPQKLSDYLARHSFSFPILHDSKNTTAAAYGIEGLPTTVLLNSDGKVVYVYEGMQPHMDYQIDYQLKQLKDTDERKKNG